MNNPTAKRKKWITPADAGKTVRRPRSKDDA